ncbi:FG-GAP repeat protein [Streptomyces sp. GESEQ-35]|uniref:FG-GAP repeat protein n=1 Tax=Streptomyces sp. GESEQ-35 TaxID=2812657 RepID=UPI001B33EA2D|nr:FG-GAP repeat protein [Streptomyces sp. GESEQ-35]
MVTGAKPTADTHLATAVYYRGTPSGLTKAANLRTASTAAIGDLNKDGYGDIVLGNPADPDTEPSASKGGKIHVIHGTGSGPSATCRVTYTRNTAGVPGTSAYADRFGRAPAIGDFDKNGYGEPAIGAPGDADPGSITLLKGSASGLTTTGAVLLTQNSTGIPGTNEWGDGVGATPPAPDINRDGRADLTAIGVGENSPAGAAWFLPKAAATG